MRGSRNVCKRGSNSVTLTFFLCVFMEERIQISLKADHHRSVGETDDGPTLNAGLVNVGHFGHGHFGQGRFGLDISATDVSATENTKGGRFRQNHKLWVGVCACINV